GSTRVRYSEIYRIEGDLQLDKSRPDPVAAEACYQEAIAVASDDGARTRQLRASTALARLWLTQGKVQQADSLLRPLYDSFNRGLRNPRPDGRQGNPRQSSAEDSLGSVKRSMKLYHWKPAPKNHGSPPNDQLWSTGDPRAGSFCTAWLGRG